MRTLKGLYILEAKSFEMIYGPQEQLEIAALADIYASPQTRESIAANPQLLAPAEVLFSGWSGPRLDEAFLDAAPNLKAVFYDAGAMGYILTPAVWEARRSRNQRNCGQFDSRGRVCFGHDPFLPEARLATGAPDPHRAALSSPGWRSGCYGRTVGLVSMGSVARILLRLLEPFELDVLVYDPYLSDEQAEAMGVKKAAPKRCSATATWSRSIRRCWRKRRE